MSSFARNPMVRRNNNMPDRQKGLSEGAIAAISVTSSVGIVIALLWLYLFLYHRKNQRRASLEAIGAQNLYRTPKSARSSQIVVTRELSATSERLPSASSYSPNTTLRGSYRSDVPLLRGSYHSATATSPTEMLRQAPPRPPRPEWPASVLEANRNLEALIPSCAPLTRPVPVYSPTSSAHGHLPASTRLFSPFSYMGGGGQVVTTYRHPTPTLGEQEDFMTMRERAQAERQLGANPGMAEVGFKREYYTMYDEKEDLKRESWRSIAVGVVLSEEARETVEWTRMYNEEIGVAR